MDIFATPWRLYNWAQFVNGEFERFLRECVIEHRKSLIWLQANEGVERRNRTLLKSMKTAAAEVKMWIDELPKFLLAYMSTPQAAAVANMFGKEIRTKIPYLWPEKSLRDKSTRDKEWEQKLKQNAYADGNRVAVSSPIAPGIKFS